jgi:hypothetical protein
VSNGTTTESGTVILITTNGKQSKIVLTLPSGVYTDIRNYSGSVHTGEITAPDGSQTLSPHDLRSPHPAWYFPAFLMSSTLSDSDYAISYVGREQRAGATVDHAALWNHPVRAPLPVAVALQADTQQDIYIDSSSSLPVSITFKLRGDYQNKSIQHWNKSVFVAKEVRFSEYRQVQGRTIASHIQFYLANNLFYDIHITSVTFNTGVVITASIRDGCAGNVWRRNLCDTSEFSVGSSF